MPDKSKYNVTDLSPDKAFDRHIFHRDQFAHFLRWTHVLKAAKIGGTVCDFGCGQGNLAEVLYRNRFKQKLYTGIDIRDVAKDVLKSLSWTRFIVDDLINPKTDLTEIQASIVASFEVLEHVGKNNVQVFLKNFMACGCDDATYYLSTPNFDPVVGAADNHTFDSGDSRGYAIQEFKYFELKQHIIEADFVIEAEYGTFASIKDYKNHMNEWQTEMFLALREYYDTNILSVLMAPMFPEQSRNCMWVLTRK